MIKGMKEYGVGERKIAILNDVTGFSPLSLDLTDTFKRFDSKTCKEAEDRQENINQMKGYIDQEFYKWSVDKEFKIASFDDLLEFAHVLLKNGNRNN